MNALSEIRNQLQTLTGAEILASQLSDVGGKVFISMNAFDSQIDFNEMVRFWRSIHAPTYGLPIPGSSASVNGTDQTGTILDPSKNQTAYITALVIENTSGSDPANVTITIGGAQFYGGSVGPSEKVNVVGFGGQAPFFLVAGQSMAISQTGVTPGEVDFSLSYSLSVQG